MKICILGPVSTNYYFGGVAIFTEGLGDGFKLNGHESYIITDFSEKKETINGTKIISVFDKKGRKNLGMPSKIANKILDINPDIVISSLEYGLANPIANKNNNILTIHYLHAFPSVKRTALNNFFVKNLTRNICNNSDYVISNSGLTSVINSEIFNTNSHEIINVGLGYDFINKIGKRKDVFDKTKKNILFAGRLVKEKNVDMVIKAFGELNRDDVVLNIIGDGKEKKVLEELANKTSPNIKFFGKVTPDEMPYYYMDADVFISLNPHEPYGIVYLEALSANTAIVCPKTGGQMDTLVDYKDRVEFINPYDIKDISKKINYAIDMKFDKLDKEYVINNFSYEKVARDIEDFIKRIG